MDSIFIQDATGPGLYQRYCAGCHGSIDDTNKRGASARAISAAIDRVPEMAILSNVDTNVLESIAEALAFEPAPPEGEAPPTRGELLYAEHCMRCHGSLDVSEKVRATPVAIATAIDLKTSRQLI